MQALEETSGGARETLEARLRELTPRSYLLRGYADLWELEWLGGGYSHEDDGTVVAQSRQRQVTIFSTQSIAPRSDILIFFSFEPLTRKYRTSFGLGLRFQEKVILGGRETDEILMAVSHYIPASPVGGTLDVLMHDGESYAKCADGTPFKPVPSVALEGIRWGPDTEHGLHLRIEEDRCVLEFLTSYGRVLGSIEAEFEVPEQYVLSLRDSGSKVVIRGFGGR
jgi:hypothetical protein